MGVIPRQEALSKAKQLGLDLIEIAASANPPVARLANFQKFRYEESKKDRGNKKSSEGGLKELWLSPRIAEHDLKVRLNRTEEFLKEGHRVKLTVKFKGREMAHQELGHKVLQEALALLGDKAGVEREPKMEGRKLSVIVGKTKGGIKGHETVIPARFAKRAKTGI
ncbi:translation initiation factor IF-3 [Candidatus Daviesbacteria bacterium RIFCSPHIGHO2_02_FULL_39_12]|uniref:Translation initiation factor IF-3 n=1 Tax=Candidatus Daviesbacteria bacterium RIFCSPHIGHO2_02_FULL_39_12 TaxID=1797770 RepID=A0A1F5J917_9BACT|nr:MAG: translation initiation factor IF-3 [Candidatus Daviesbacteria bacterium RIFCSPHIGHO2_02_FULL_39_12]